MRRTLHLLNQRYRREWQRAERLQDELDHIKSSRVYRLLCLWRDFARLWRSTPRHAAPVCDDFDMELLDHERGFAAGTVSVIIPFRNQGHLLRGCLRSLRRGSYPPGEILLLDNDSTCPRTLRLLDRLASKPSIQVVACPGPFNFSRLCNMGAARASGDHLLFLNNDTEGLGPDWLERLLELAVSPRIGIVGATLLYPDRTLQHAGILPDRTGEWHHVYRGQPHDHAGDRGELRHVRSVPAVTGACLLIARRLFTELGGFDERYPVTHNDVDLCVRVRRLGLKVAISPHARLWHFESLSRGYARSPAPPPQQPV